MVDVVSENGFKWIKVSARNPSAYKRQWQTLAQERPDEEEDDHCPLTREADRIACPSISKEEEEKDIEEDDSLRPAGNHMVYTLSKLENILSDCPFNFYSQPL